VERRAFVAGTLAPLAVPLVGEAQPTRVYRVGVVLDGGPYYPAINELRDGLGELGFEEGKQYMLSVRDAKGGSDGGGGGREKSRRGEGRPDLRGGHLGHARGQAGDQARPDRGIRRRGGSALCYGANLVELSRRAAH
jgi:hypothetical protein